MAKLPGAVQGARIVGERYVRSQRRQNPEGRMPLFDHLRELRNRIVKMALGLIAGMVVGFIFFQPVWRVIEHPLCAAKIRGYTGCGQLGVNQLVLNGPLDAFYLRVKVALIVGIILSSPLWLYQLWAFIAPGLYSREKKWAYLFTGTAVPLFVGGAFLAYFVMGRGLHYLLGLAPHGVGVLPSFDTYLSYFTGMMVGFGLVFELPLVIVMLNMAGVLTHERFRKWRRMLIFGVFLLSGLVNPSPDPWTMLILGALAVALVEVAEIFVYFNDKRRARRHPDPYAGLSDDKLSPIDDAEPADSGSSLN